MILVKEAGGFVTDLSGGPDMLTKSEICAGNEAIHRQLLDLLRKA